MLENPAIPLAEKIVELPVIQTEEKMNSVLDSGHLLDQVLKRSGILWKRIVHKEFGIISRTRCCWNSQKADILFSAQQLHCPGEISKAKDMENCRFTIVPIRQRLRPFFA